VPHSPTDDAPIEVATRPAVTTSANKSGRTAGFPPAIRAAGGQLPFDPHSPFVFFQLRPNAVGSRQPRWRLGGAHMTYNSEAVTDRASNSVSTIDFREHVIDRVHPAPVDAGVNQAAGLSMENTMPCVARPKRPCHRSGTVQFLSTTAPIETAVAVWTIPKRRL